MSVTDKAAYELIIQLVDHGFETLNAEGDIVCHFCSGKGMHETDCVWLKAKRFTDLLEICPWLLA